VDSPSIFQIDIGEPGGIRTRDPLIKSQVLYRLSYGLFEQGADHRSATMPRSIHAPPSRLHACREICSGDAIVEGNRAAYEGLQEFTQNHRRYIKGLHSAPMLVQWQVRTQNDNDRGTKQMDGFGSLLQNEIPRLRRYARALTRDATRADDLVQSCLVRALAKSHLWQPGTDLRAWLFTILHNQHVNEVRRAVREGVNVPVEDVAPVLTVPSSQGASLQLRDLDRAMARLPEEQRQVLLLVGLEGMRYEEVALVLDVPVGTVRSRLSRGRDMLRHLMDMKVRPENEADEESQPVPRARRRAAA
jgi:RNA polymerase sigma-70 factor (ECF subfamily)